MLGQLTIDKLINCLEATGKISKELKLLQNKDKKFYITRVSRISKNNSYFSYFQKKENMLLFLSLNKLKNFIGFFNPQSHSITVNQQQRKKEIFQNYVFEFLMDKSNYYPLEKLIEIAYSKEKIYLTLDLQKYQIDFKNEMLASSWFSLITDKQKSIKVSQREKYQIMEENQNGQQLRQIQYTQQKLPLKNQALQKKSKEEKYIEQNLKLEAKLQDLNQQLKQIIAESQESNKKQLQKIELLYKQNQDLNIRFKQLSQYLQKKEQTYDNQRKVYQTQLQEQKRINKENMLLIKQYDEYKQQAEQLKKILNQQTQKINELEMQINNLCSENICYSQNIQEEKVIFMREKMELEAQIKTEQQKIKALAILMQKQQYLHIFQGSILHGVSFEKTYLKESILDLMKKRIKYSQLIYKYDPLNLVSFHNYIDEKSNICIIIKLKNGRLVAGFSASALSEKTIANQTGIICSLTEKKSYKLIEGKRSVTYDKFFLIFGNSELRLKQGEVKFFTNFGISNSFFDSKGEKYTVLNGEGTEREVIYENFQIFQVFFK